MTVTKVTQRAVPPEMEMLPELKQPAAPVNAEKRKLYEQNSIAPAPEPSFIGRVWNSWVKGIFSEKERQKDTLAPSQKQRVKSVQQRPEIDPPAHAVSSSRSMEHLRPIAAVCEKGADGFGRLSETELERLVMEAMKNESVNYRMKSTNETDLAELTMKIKDHLKNFFLKVTREAEEKKKSAKILNWTSIGTGAMAGALGLSAIVVSVATGGVGGVVIGLSVAGSIGGIASGSSQIASGVYKYKGDALARDAFKTKHDMREAAESVRVFVVNIEDSERTIAEIHRMLRQVLDNKPRIFDGG